jgi:hypothetical protein
MSTSLQTILASDAQVAEEQFVHEEQASHMIALLQY